MCVGGLSTSSFDIRGFVFGSINNHGYLPQAYLLACVDIYLPFPCKGLLNMQLGLAGWLSIQKFELMIEWIERSGFIRGIYGESDFYEGRDRMVR